MPGCCQGRMWWITMVQKGEIEFEFSATEIFFHSSRHRGKHRPKSKFFASTCQLQ